MEVYTVSTIRTNELLGIYTTQDIAIRACRLTYHGCGGVQVEYKKGYVLVTPNGKDHNPLAITKQFVHNTPEHM